MEFVIDEVRVSETNHLGMKRVDEFWNFNN